LTDRECSLNRVKCGATVRRERGHHVGRQQVAARDDVAEQLNRSRCFRRIIQQQVRGQKDGICPCLRVHHCRISNGYEVGMGLAESIVLFLVLSGGLEPLSSCGAEVLDGVLDILDSLAQRRDHILVGPELDDLTELSDHDFLRISHFFGTLLQSLDATGRQKRRSLTCKVRAFARELKACGQPWNVLSTEINHHLAELAEQHARADADDDGHSPDHRKGCNEAAPDTQLNAQRAQWSWFSDCRWQSHAIPRPSNP
jgi:hypothetical protein